MPESIIIHDDFFGFEIDFAERLITKRNFEIMEKDLESEEKIY